MSNKYNMNCYFKIIYIRSYTRAQKTVNFS